jgi:hypothetical protein
MTLTISLILYIIAAVLFGIAAFGYEPPRFSLVAAGLMFLTLGLIFGGR